ELQFQAGGTTVSSGWNYSFKVRFETNHKIALSYLEIKLGSTTMINSPMKCSEGQVKELPFTHKSLIHRQHRRKVKEVEEYIYL
ncbi:hypothetical protein, partial [uncultured Bacteroides sp.]|uniref:hypothetical protein n=1 Tax=uncultured Bacteroides sp. TaxID=162156 RepID=UPI0025EF5ED8